MSVTTSKLRESVAVPLEPLLSIDDFAGFLNAGRRTIDRMRAAGQLPKPDLHVGKMPRWRPETVRAWMDRQGRQN